MAIPPEISVVMSVYNGADTLRSTIDSVLCQEGVDFEFIIVNDGSKDNSRAILDAYAAQDKRVRVIHQVNGGLTRALITGCAAARGTFIARQDGGDLSLPMRLSMQHQALKQFTSCSFVSCWTNIVGPNEEDLWMAQGTGRAKTPCCVLDLQSEWGMVDGPSHHTSVMFPRQAYEAVGGYRSQFYFGQDWDLWYRLAAVGDFLMIEKALCSARLAPGSISGSYKKVQEQFAKLSREAMRTRSTGHSDEAVLNKASRVRLPAKGKSPSRAQRAAALYFIGRALSKKGDPRGLQYLKGALQHNPLSLRNWFGLAQALVVAREQTGLME